MTTAAVLAREVEARARRNPEFAEVVDALLEAPTQPAGTLERIGARKLNDARNAVLIDEFRDGALPTPDVQELLRVRTPQAVHQLRSRGKLLGDTVGNRTWFPAWQFNAGRIRPDLPQILELLTRFTSDPIAADRIMRITHDELGGVSIAEALRRKKTAETAWRMLAALGA
jgi:hypothetical protein